MSSGSLNNSGPYQRRDRLSAHCLVPGGGAVQYPLAEVNGVPGPGIPAAVSTQTEKARRRCYVTHSCVLALILLLVACTSDAAAPTPVPTPSVGPFPTQLSAEGLLAAGWPGINLELIQPEYQDVTYRYTSFRYINQWGSQTSIPPDVLEEHEALDITYRIEADLPPPLCPIVTDDPVTDRARIFRFKDRPASEVIVLDQCPVDFQGDQFLFYEVRQPR